ncbi:MAG: aminotransferase class V-fold PLP-dependent enzyme [Clostridia bacterium]|nr:aminotransferase class V-fold PLP-dependent enzyme [Clostridia bacterium]
MIYFDCAASSLKKPPSVYDAYLDAMRRFSCGVGRSGYGAAVRAGELIYAAREDIADFFGMQSASGVIFTQNATHAINIALKGALSAGDRLVISDMEHNAVYRSALWLGSRGVSVDFSHAAHSDDETCESFAAAFERGARAVCVTHVSNVFGNVLPIRRIFREARRRGIITILDASQSAGSIRINMTDDFIDILCCPGHKGLMGPQGTGLLLINGDVTLSPLIHGGTGGASRDEDMPEYLPDRFEAGTGHTAGAIALGEGVRFIKSIGCEAIFDHEKSLAALMKRGLSKIGGVTVYEYGENTAGLFSFNIDALDCEQTAARLWEHGICVRSGLHCAPLAHKTVGTLERGTVRVSAGAFNKKSEADALLRAVRDIARGSA